jgi:LPS export ABC transporter protein LptC
MMVIKKHLYRLRSGPRGRGRSFATAIALSLLAIACGEEESTPVASPPLLETGADMVIQGLRHLITLDGIKEGEIFADTAFFYRDSSLYHLRKPELILFTESGARRAQITADRGRFNPNTREMLAQGGVILVITEGDKRVESEELHYNPNGDRIWSDSATTMIEPGRISEGFGFESDLNFRRTVVGPGSIRNTGGGGGAPD